MDPLPFLSPLRRCSVIRLLRSPAVFCQHSSWVSGRVRRTLEEKLHALLEVWQFGEPCLSSDPYHVKVELYVNALTFVAADATRAMHKAVHILEDAAGHAEYDSQG